MHTSRFTAALAAAVISVGAISLVAQSAIPTQGARGQGQGGRGEGRGGEGRGGRAGGAPQRSNRPATPVAAPLPTISAEVTGPGPMFESLMALPACDDMANWKYEAREYFVSGT